MSMVGLLAPTASLNKPIYLVGESFGGCLALAAAAKNPTIDLVLILVNPATSFGRSQLQPLLPILDGLPEGLHFTVPYLLSFIIDEPLKMAMVNIDKRHPPAFVLKVVYRNLNALLPHLPVKCPTVSSSLSLSNLSNIIPKDTLPWKLKLLRTAAAYANSRLHASDIFWTKYVLLARVRICKDNSHALLLEDGINLMSAIKGMCLYRHSRRRDYISDYSPLGISEYDMLLITHWGNSVRSSAVCEIPKK